MVDPCPRCFRPARECLAADGGSELILECRELELELTKKQLACAHELIKRSRALLRRTLAQLDQAILTTEPDRLSLASDPVVFQGQGETDG